MGPVAGGGTETTNPAISACVVEAFKAIDHGREWQADFYVPGETARLNPWSIDTVVAGSQMVVAKRLAIQTVLADSIIRIDTFITSKTVVAIDTVYNFVEANDTTASINGVDTVLMMVATAQPETLYFRDSVMITDTQIVVTSVEGQAGLAKTMVSAPVKVDSTVTYTTNHRYSLQTLTPPVIPVAVDSVVINTITDTVIYPLVDNYQLPDSIVDSAGNVIYVMRSAVTIDMASLRIFATRSSSAYIFAAGVAPRQPFNLTFDSVICGANNMYSYQFTASDSLNQTLLYLPAISNRILGGDSITATYSRSRYTTNSAGDRIFESFKDGDGNGVLATAVNSDPVVRYIATINRSAGTSNVETVFKGGSDRTLSTSTDNPIIKLVRADNTANWSRSVVYLPDSLRDTIALVNRMMCRSPHSVVESLNVSYVVTGGLNRTNQKLNGLTRTITYKTGSIERMEITLLPNTAVTGDAQIQDARLSARMFLRDGSIYTIVNGRIDRATGQVIGLISDGGVLRIFEAASDGTIFR